MYITYALSAYKGVGLSTENYTFGLRKVYTSQLAKLDIVRKLEQRFVPEKKQRAGSCEGVRLRGCYKIDFYYIQNNRF